jgi:hypothetical protein
VIHSLTENIGKFKNCNSLVYLFLLGVNVFTLDSNERYFRSRNLALPQDSRSLRGLTVICGQSSACPCWRDSVGGFVLWCVLFINALKGHVVCVGRMLWVKRRENCGVPVLCNSIISCGRAVHLYTTSSGGKCAHMPVYVCKVCHTHLLPK